MARQLVAVQGLHDDLGRMIDAVRAHDTALLLITYPYDIGAYGLASRATRAVAEE